MISWMDARVIGSRRTGPFPVSHPRVETWKRMETKMETELFPTAWKWKPTIRKLGNAWRKRRLFGFAVGHLRGPPRTDPLAVSVWVRT